MFSAPSGRTRLKVLVVDDDPLLRELVSFQLGNFGCSALVAESGVEALQQLQTQEFDLLVTDWQMPGMDGMELVAATRALMSEDRYLHIAMMTARGNETVIHAAMEAGVDDFLYKPIQPVELELVMRSASRNRLLHHRLKRRNALTAAAHRRAREALDRIQADLAAATALHERLLPAFERHGVLELAHYYQPAAVIGGDSIGVSQLREDGLLFFLVDVCGHGVPAALDSFHLHHRLKQLRPMSAADLAGCLATINREICDRGDDSYATVVCGLVFPEQEEGWLICAGHPPPLLQIGAQVVPMEGGRTMPVGWFEDVTFEPARFAFPRGSRLVLYSDGITEAASGDGKEFGVDRLVEVVATGSANPVGELIQALSRELRNLRPVRGFEDDISLLAITHGAERASTT